MLKGFLLCHLYFHWNSLSRINSPWMYLYILLKSNAVLTHEDTNLKHKHIHIHRILKQLFPQLSISHLIKFVKSSKQFKSVSRVFYRVNWKFTWYKFAKLIWTLLRFYKLNEMRNNQLRKEMVIQQNDKHAYIYYHFSIVRLMHSIGVQIYIGRTSHILFHMKFCNVPNFEFKSMFWTFFWAIS